MEFSVSTNSTVQWIQYFEKLKIQSKVFDEFGPLVNSNFGEFTRLSFEPKKAP